MFSCTQRCLIHPSPPSATHPRTISSTPGHPLYRHPFSTMTSTLIQCPRDVTFSLQPTSTHARKHFPHPLSVRTISSFILAHVLLQLPRSCSSSLFSALDWSSTSSQVLQLNNTRFHVIAHVLLHTTMPHTSPAAICNSLWHHILNAWAPPL